jgi:hypothetical protein
MRVMNTCLLTLALLLPAAATADENFRCGKWIASSDMTVADLLAKCGAPASKTRTTEDVLVRNQNTGLMRKTGETVIETWIYDRGGNAAPMAVTIVDGRIKSIERVKRDRG